MHIHLTEGASNVYILTIKPRLMIHEPSTTASRIEAANPPKTISSSPKEMKSAHAALFLLALVLVASPSGTRSSHPRHTPPVSCRDSFLQDPELFPDRCRWHGGQHCRRVLGDYAVSGWEVHSEGLQLALRGELRRRHRRLHRCPTMRVLVLLYVAQWNSRR